jgi:hypothetical protein
VPGVSISGTAHVACPACGREHDVKLVQSINSAKDAEEKRLLLAGELDVLVCECGKRTQLVANLLFHDPDRDFYGRVVPGGGDAALEEAAAQFRASGATGAQRIVPSLNALVEKVKILEAGLEDWAIEMTKALLLSTVGDLDRVLLFDRVDVDTLRWVLFDAQGRQPSAMASPLESYRRIAAREASRPATTEYRIDRAWAVQAVQAMIRAGN